MRYLLDTDVVSQLSKPVPHPAAYAWIQNQNDADVFLSSITLFELRFGVEEMKLGKKRDAVEAFVTTEIPERFRDRILQIDAAVADLAAGLFSRSLHNNGGMDAMDAMIAATATHHGMVLATLNRKHFDWLGIALVSF